MDTSKWLEQVEANKEKLRGLIQGYHPQNQRPHLPTEKMADEITARQAERACEVIRNQIRAESLDCPEIQFDIALKKKDVSTINNLLSSTWFGVPESTSCWSIAGFSEAVSLLEDPPEDY